MLSPDNQEQSEFQEVVIESLPQLAVAILNTSLDSRAFSLSNYYSILKQEACIRSPSEKNTPDTN